MPAITYPKTERSDVREEHFGVTVADPYRWLENDVRADTKVADWVEDQNQVTDTYLDALPARKAFQDRMTELFDYERLSVPQKRGARYFYLRFAGSTGHGVLHVREGLDGADRVLIDPNAWSKDGSVALGEWSVSDDGEHLAYAVQDGGADWRTIRVLKVATGEILGDEVRWARFTALDWMKDGSGFFYCRYPEPEAGMALQASVENHAIYFHRLGTPQAEDRLLYATPDQPRLLHLFEITKDGRYAVIISSPGTMAAALTVVDLTEAAWRPRKLIEDFDNEWNVFGNRGTKLFIGTSRDAERRKLVTLDLAEANPVFTDLVGEREAVLTSAWLIGGRVLASYLVDAKTEILRYDLEGRPDGVVEQPGIGSVLGFQGDPDDPESFFVFTSYDAPTTVYRYDVETREASIWTKPQLPPGLDRIVVEQHFCTSKDGTRVPMFVMRRKDVTGPAPTLLYGYGGFSINLVPIYFPPYQAWVEQGGVLAVVNLRGGGEYGRAWHEAGRLGNKQNVFDDFIATAEYLQAQGIASPDGLAIKGESNGGLLVGAVVNQRPELFAAALPGVGVMDMLRYDRFTGGHLWLPEYGSPAEEAHFRNLMTYSPYHTIAQSKTYPAILVTTADMDDRVVPAHSFKYIAAVQAADLGPRPHLIHVETRSGHGMGKPTEKVIAEYADQWAFAARWTGLDVKPV
ncbi:prolyl oligopeptidase family serine peptidase [Roseococcus pinisoli]|uniref:prolyl oligopeptidase n=1 Tax=Roseococcus pinisoli TaxID=2835040 RepID=A0ABS5Q7Y8_9PROT|nr:prolyl oligopeptidase family serine peptidase [Roseococcus pinisoli]MBS7809775.1 S9 family peptidase [Roseococcus pinisoli]